MGNKRQTLLLTVNGQSTVEYLLLLMVVVTLSLSIYRGKAFQAFFGQDSEFFNSMARRIEFAYRHGYEGSGDDPSYEGLHRTFYDVSTGKSRFFIQDGEYVGF